MPYPVHWTPVSLNGTLAAVEAPDRDSLISLFEQQTTWSWSQADLQSIAQQQILQVGSPVVSPVYKMINLDGTPALLALANGVGINTGNTVGEAQVSVVVAAIHQRICVARGDSPGEQQHNHCTGNLPVLHTLHDSGPARGVRL